MLDKAIQHKKEKRKPYRGSKAFDHTCRNHGSCSYCESNRTIFDKKARARVEGQEDEVLSEWQGGDPDDVNEDVVNEALEKIDVDPWDFETRRELDV